MTKFGGGLFSRLLGKGDTVPESPMSSLRAATRWAENLPLGDVFRSQRAFTSELKQFNSQERTCTADQFAALMLLDEKSRELQATLSSQYLRNPRMPRDVESQLWHTIYELEWELALGYRAFVLAYTRSSGRRPYEKDVPRAALRAILHYGALLKWRALRYLDPSERMWQRLHALYHAIESEGLHRKPVLAYDDDRAPRTIESVFVNILMLDLVNNGTFYPRQIDLVDHWLAHWNPTYQVVSEFSAESSIFTVDLSADHGPRRARNPAPDRPVRYWDSEPVLRIVRKTMDNIREGMAPSALGLSESVRTGECQSLLEILLRQWSGDSGREQRRAPRTQTKRPVELAYGLKDVLELVEGAIGGNSRSFYDEAQDMQVYGFVTNRTRTRVRQNQNDGPHIERWVLHDESSCGWGALIEVQTRDWLRVGVLVAIRHGEQDPWQVGVVRRLSRAGIESFSVGIERIGDSIVIGELTDVAPDGYTVSVDGHIGGEKHHEVLINRRGASTSLLLDPVYFQPEHSWTLHSGTGAERVKLTKPLQYGEGWMEAAFEAF